ncbi:ABC transporter substrate-binding protein [Microbacterium sp. No. 7]|uniref:ABC transporter substrate-binding protein n=1 Tax=Microbacterium sp. No. 7 TaxID=1714373 RepID=UPI000A9B4747|nr:ABC transporter substrate-binding protein [Microbacterium sp. No. 7]
MTLRLSYFVPPAPLVVAQELSLAGVSDLSEEVTTGSPAQLAGLLDGTIDVVVTAIDNLFEWVRAGADVRLVAQVESTTPLAIFARPDIDTIAELAGKRFGVDAFANGFALVARCLLADADAEVEYVEVGGVKQRLEALLAGEVDATLLGPPFDARALAAGQNQICSIQEEFSAFPGQGVIVRRELLASADVVALLDALRRGGALNVDLAGLELLTDIRRKLGVLPEGVELRSLVA